MTLFKNLLLSAGLLLAAGTALSAQELGKLHYRAEAGLAISRMSDFSVHPKGGAKFLPSLRIGGSLVMPFDNTIFAFTPGLYLSGRGEKQGSLSNDQKSPSAVQTYALQLPLEMSFRLGTIAEKHRIFLNVGPYFAYGLSSKLTGDNTIDLYKEDDFKRFEFGLETNLMYQYKHIYLRGGIEASLTGVVKRSLGAPYSVGLGTPRYLTSYVTLGYEF
ncbi:outer membrane beta-barrel protein [Porphyromonas sp.]